MTYLHIYVEGSEGKPLSMHKWKWFLKDWEKQETAADEIMPPLPHPPGSLFIRRTVNAAEESVAAAQKKQSERGFYLEFLSENWSRRRPPPDT